MHLRPLQALSTSLRQGQKWLRSLSTPSVIEEEGEVWRTRPLPQLRLAPAAMCQRPHQTLQPNRTSLGGPFQRLAVRAVSWESRTRTRPMTLVRPLARSPILRTSLPQEHTSGQQAVRTQINKVLSKTWCREVLQLSSITLSSESSFNQFTDIKKGLTQRTHTLYTNI